mmetsp:Transcript_106189/g.210981  ORF Transcript_106189/g.210981 Transcript_106189/m.210981 type:complete len:368 (+) Transcript_106189:40-1143(+)
MQSGGVLHLSACLALDPAHNTPGPTAVVAAAAAAADAAATAAEAAVAAAAAAQQAADAASNASARVSYAAPHYGNGRTPVRRRAVRPDDSWRMAPPKRRSKSPGYQQNSGKSRRLPSKHRQPWTAKGCHPDSGGHSTKAKDGQPRKAQPRHYWSPGSKGGQGQGSEARAQSRKWKVVEHPSSSSGTAVHQSSQTIHDAVEPTSSTNADDSTNPASSSSPAGPQRYSMTERDSDDDEADFFPKNSMESREPGGEVAETLDTPESSDVTAAHVPQQAPQDDCLQHQSSPDTVGPVSGSNAEDSKHNESRQSEPVEEPRVGLHVGAQAMQQTESQAELPEVSQAGLQTEPHGELHERKEVDTQQASGMEE